MRAPSYKSIYPNFEHGIVPVEQRRSMRPAKDSPRLTAVVVTAMFCGAVWGQVIAAIVRGGW